MLSSKLGMDSSYQDNSKAQSICHHMASQQLIKSAHQIYQNLKNSSDIVRIGVFGCGPGNNDLWALEEYVIPHLPNRKVEIYMLDIVDTKWLSQKC